MVHGSSEWKESVMVAGVRNRLRAAAAFCADNSETCEELARGQMAVLFDQWSGQATSWGKGM